MLREYFSSGRDRARRHCWTSSFKNSQETLYHQFLVYRTPPLLTLNGDPFAEKRFPLHNDIVDPRPDTQFQKKLMVCVCFLKDAPTPRI